MVYLLSKYWIMIKYFVKKKMEFKEKETDNFIFKRHYDFLQDGNVKFTISLTDKLHDISSSDFTILHPLKRNTILSLFEQAGFQSVESYSDYRFTKSNAEDYAVVYVARLCVWWYLLLTKVGTDRCPCQCFGVDVILKNDYILKDDPITLG